MTVVLDAPAFDQERYDSGRYDGTLEVLDRTGDTKIMWDKSNDVEVDVARAAFDKLKKAGHLLYRAEGKDGHQGEQVRTFDKKHERLIAVPQLVGG